MLQFLIEHRHIVQYALFFGLTAFAFWRGQAPEKLTGMVFIGAIVLVMLHSAFKDDLTFILSLIHI